MFKLFRSIFLLIALLIFISCNDNDMTPIRTRKIAPKVSSVFKSPAYNLRIKYIILHYTALNDDLSLKVLTDPGVSAHYLITTREDEPIYKLVDDNDRAWHAGITMFDNRYSMNDSSIGIEIVNLGFLEKVTNTYERLRRMSKIERENLFFTPYDEYLEFDDSQIDKVVYLLKELIDKYDIKPYNILGHSDIAPYRKKDPGPKFPWKMLHDEYNLGIWYDDYDYSNFLNDDKYRRTPVKKIKEEFIKYGYTSMPTNNIWDLDSRKVLYAFQCHFRPEKIDGNIDNESYAIIRALNSKVRKINEREERSQLNKFFTNTFHTNIFISNNIASTNWNYNTNILFKR
ncbi:N-acetylmuramoyl-L-alanine amidase [uncultured Brachyspira sp.]|uniref:N-acetylmuramoyl-L-alanine amidase n=1 Tax=uncultured Brachyspira sp. TaxID=221953 RepID=UPI0026291EA6|nr:N-acetylmuramoyl-L-alanine amidase [uncultured Brachyspira sp.]